MPRSPTNKLVRSQLDADARREARFVDLQLDFVEHGTKRHLARFGGLWDRLEKEYAGDAPRSRIIEVHAQQIRAIERFDLWFKSHLDPEQAVLEAAERAMLDAVARNDDGAETLAQRTAHIRDTIANDRELDAEAISAIGLAELFLSGGRRSGKSTIMLSLLASYAIAVPESIVWCVVPSEQFHVEPKDIIEAICPRDWYGYNGAPFYTFYFCNGSQLVIRSGHHAGSLKKGKAALVGLNEAQQISEASYRNARGAVVDDGGFVISALNPPTAGDIGAWTADAIQAIAKNGRPGGEHIFIDPLDNPHIDVAKLLAMRSGMTEHDWETQIRGRILAHPDAVIYTWDAAANERRPPDLGKITHAFLTAHEGDRASWSTLVVADVQNFPWIAAGIFDVYRDPRAPEDMRKGLLWMREEVALAQGDEVDVCTELKRRGIDPARTLVVLDASCWWQQAQRDETKQRPEYRGKGSSDIFKACGFIHCVPPDRNMKRNPDVLERVRATNALARPADNIRGLFIDSDRCTNAAESVRKWRAKNGKPSRYSKSAHFGDVVGYACWRFFPRRGTASKLLQSEVLTRPRAEGYERIP